MSNKNKIPSICSWSGLEEYRDRIRQIAQEVVTSDAIVRKKYRSSVATGLICQGMRIKSNDADVNRASKAQEDLFDLQHELVWKHGLEFDFVRREWAVILDPSDEERIRCDKLALAAEKHWRRLNKNI